MTEKTMLEDGVYHCSATLHIADGKALLILDKTFKLKPGTSIPLLRKENNLLVELTQGTQTGIKNGHMIV